MQPQRAFKELYLYFLHETLSLQVRKLDEIQRVYTIVLHSKVAKTINFMLCIFFTMKFFTKSNFHKCYENSCLLLCPWNSPGKNTGVGSHSLLQGIFPNQQSNLGLWHCRQILYHLSHQASPK